MSPVWPNPFISLNNTTSSCINFHRTLRAEITCASTSYPRIFNVGYLVSKLFFNDFFSIGESDKMKYLTQNTKVECKQEAIAIGLRRGLRKSCNTLVNVTRGHYSTVLKNLHTLKIWYLRWKTFSTTPHFHNVHSLLRGRQRKGLFLKPIFWACIQFFIVSTFLATISCYNMLLVVRKYSEDSKIVWKPEMNATVRYVQ